MLGSIEENWRHEIHELQKLWEERTIIIKELDFYKEQAEKLSTSLKRLKDEQDDQLRDARSKELEKQQSVLRLQADIDGLSEETRKLNNHLRIAKADINALQKVNDDLTL